MRKLTIALFLALGVIAPNVSAKIYSQARTMALHLVQKIYVEDMGTSPEAARFRLLLEDQLSENGFVVVARRLEADAVRPRLGQEIEACSRAVSENCRHQTSLSDPFQELSPMPNNSLDASGGGLFLN